MRTPVEKHGTGTVALELTQKSPIRHVNIFLFGLVGLTDVLYSVYVFTYICLDGSTVSVMVCDCDDVSIRSGVRISIVTFYLLCFPRE